MKPAVARWLEFAEIDLRAAKTLLEEGGLSSVVCFHAQQCVEKSLKALIESRGLNPPKSHDLIMLYGITEELVTLEEDTLAKMNQVYIDARYPASLGTMPDGLPGDDDAADFYGVAEEVFSKVKAVL